MNKTLASKMIKWLKKYRKYDVNNLHGALDDFIQTYDVNFVVWNKNLKDLLWNCMTKDLKDAYKAVK